MIKTLTVLLALAALSAPATAAGASLTVRARAGRQAARAVRVAAASVPRMTLGAEGCPVSVRVQFGAARQAVTLAARQHRTLTFGAVRAGRYRLTLAARVRRGRCRDTVIIAAFTLSRVMSPSPPVSPTPPAVPVPPTPPSPVSSDPLAALPFYVQKGTDASRAQAQLLAEGQTANARLLGRIAGRPQAVWLGDWNGPDPSADAAAVVNAARSQDEMPVFVAYNIPGRDCGSYSSGGATSADAYRRWIDGLASALGGWPSAVIVEPDAIPQIGCFTADQQAQTLALLRYAVQTLAARAHTAVYLDAGHSSWQPASVISQRLTAAGVSQARGFSLNVSNFNRTADELAYGKQVSALTDGAHFVIDTSRNGQGPTPDHAWCNPAGRGLGTPPTTATGDTLADAFLWVKTPGESDGACNGGPPAGHWWLDYALGLAANAA
jgi:endoglucanase